AGLAMSGISIVLKSSRSDGVRWTAMLALRMWTAALVWLMTRRRKQEEKAAEPPPPPPPVHRTLDCSLERPLVENLGRAEKQLHELAIEEAW
ncbi:hypothetical protein, partial [Halalkalibacter lacteus]|uniref:hypothetical protein n=1 Tax=Halalkalibacter lacteus TaxID=3090663 RepID=UPI002FC8A574